MDKRAVEFYCLGSNPSPETCCDIVIVTVVIYLFICLGPHIAVFRGSPGSVLTEVLLEILSRMARIKSVFALCKLIFTHILQRKKLSSGMSS